MSSLRCMIQITTWRSGWVGSTTLISSAFTALLNCAEVGRRNRILTNYRFLSHSLLFCFFHIRFFFEHWIWDGLVGPDNLCYYWMANDILGREMQMCIRDRSWSPSKGFGSWGPIVNGTSRSNSFRKKQPVYPKQGTKLPLSSILLDL